MLNFNELPEDGTAFEQLTRELLLVAGLSANWTGKGPDQGRDLIAEEVATGPLGSFRRRWLVQCKHLAQSDRSVGRKDIPSVIDDCRQASAEGYLLVCSTQSSAGVILKLREIAADPKNHLVTAVWDCVEIEKRLSEPRGFALAHIFFPKSMQKTPWRVYNAGSPFKWAAHFKEYFVYLHSRVSSYFPSLSDIEEIIRRLEKIRPQEVHEAIRPRAVYFDDKNEQFYVFADYLVPKDSEPSLSPRDFEKELQDGQGLYRDEKSMWCLTWWDIKLVRTDPWSDRYHVDSASYYEPYLRNFEVGLARSGTISELRHFSKWL